jgi:xylulokinase
MLASVGAGWFSDVSSACDSLFVASPVAEPSSSVPAYEEAYARYRELYPALAPTFHQL